MDEEKKQKLLRRQVELKILNLAPGTLFNMNTGKPATKNDDSNDLMRKPYNKIKGNVYTRENREAIMGEDFEPLRKVHGKAKGGKVAKKKKMMGGSVKKYAMGGGMRKAKTYG